MFITFEGPEGAGKSTAIRAVADHLSSLGFHVVATREPGGSDIGKQIRAILLEGGDLAPAAELMLFWADRAEHVHRVVGPALEAGSVVLCDRFSDSTLAYQGYARGHDIDFLRRGNAMATGGLTPDLTLLFDLPVHIGLGRLQSKDRLDGESIEFHERVRQGFLELSQQELSRWVVLDATQAPETVVQSAMAAIRDRLKPDGRAASQ